MINFRALDRELWVFELFDIVGPVLKPIYAFLASQSLDNHALRRDVQKTVLEMLIKHEAELVTA